MSQSLLQRAGPYRDTHGGTAPGQNRGPARIADVTYLGEDLHLSLDLASGDRLRASLKNANAARGWAPGSGC
jgi:hypothetical protein